MDQLRVGVTAILSFHFSRADQRLISPFTYSSSPMTSTSPDVASVSIATQRRILEVLIYIPTYKHALFKHRKTFSKNTIAIVQ